jgi:spermidine/putrescine transport system substrate-binding protein
MKTVANAALAFATALFAFVQLARAEDKNLVLYNWSSYISPDLLKRFKSETGISVTLDTYDSNETMISKLEAGGGGYDVVVPSGQVVQLMVREGLLMQIDVSKMQNFKYVKAPFDKPNFDPQRLYTAPYMWGITGLAYDTAKLRGGKITDSWKELFEPRSEFAGNIGMLRDGGEVINAASWYLGIPACTTDPKQAKDILDLLENQKKYVKVYNSEGTVDRVANSDVSMELMWNGSYHRAHKKLPSVAFVFPKEGVTWWGDNLAIPKGARNVENAKVFINWLMDPKNAGVASNYTGYANAIEGAGEYLEPDIRNDPAVNVSNETMKLFKPSEQCSKAALDMRDKIWTRLFR